MQKEILTDSWLTTDPIDLEYKKYLVLAYNQITNENLNKKKIYPTLTDIVDQLMYVNGFLKYMIEFENSAKKVDRVDWLNKEVIYKTKIDDDSFDDIKELAIFSKAILSDLYIKYKNLYDDVDGTIQIHGSQFSLFDKYRGYMIMKYRNRKDKIMEYEIYKTLIPEPTFHVKTAKAKEKNYYQNRLNRNIFEIIVNEEFPVKETTIPVIRRKFLMHVLGGYLL